MTFEITCPICKERFLKPNDNCTKKSYCDKCKREFSEKETFEIVGKQSISGLKPTKITF